MNLCGRSPPIWAISTNHTELVMSRKWISSKKRQYALRFSNPRKTVIHKMRMSRNGDQCVM